MFLINLGGNVAAVDNGYKLAAYAVTVRIVIDNDRADVWTQALVIYRFFFYEIQNLGLLPLLCIKVGELFK